MNAAQKLYKEYQKELAQLQATCPHAKLTDWIEEWWAPGHPTGRKVQMCANCDKVIQAARPCTACGKELPEGELRHGDGRSLPANGPYCQSCYPRELSQVKAAQEELM